MKIALSRNHRRLPEDEVTLRPSRQVVVEPGRHPTTTDNLILGNTVPLRLLDRSAGAPLTLVGASYGTRGARGGEGEVRIAGSWDLDGGDNWDACRGLKYDGKDLVAVDHPQDGNIGSAGRGGDFPYGEVVMCEGWRGGDGGLLQNVALVNHRSEMNLHQGVGVMTVTGGEWEMLECEIAVHLYIRHCINQRISLKSIPPQTHQRDL